MGGGGFSLLKFIDSVSAFLSELHWYKYTVIKIRRIKLPVATHGEEKESDNKMLPCSEAMSHGSGRLDGGASVPLQRGSQSIHYGEMIFQYFSCMKQQRGLFTLLHERVTCLTAVTPSVWFTSLTKTLLDRTVELVKFNPAKLPFPQLCTDTDMHVCKRARM